MKQAVPFWLHLFCNLHRGFFLLQPPSINLISSSSMFLIRSFYWHSYNIIFFSTFCACSPGMSLPLQSCLIHFILPFLIIAIRTSASSAQPLGTFFLLLCPQHSLQFTHLPLSVSLVFYTMLFFYVSSFHKSLCNIVSSVSIWIHQLPSHLLCTVTKLPFTFFFTNISSFIWLSSFLIMVMIMT